jgi:hypothetical protein
MKCKFLGKTKYQHLLLQYDMTYLLIITIFLVVLVFELGTLHLLGRCSTT